MTGTTHDELVERLDKGVMVVTAKGADGIRATLLTPGSPVLQDCGCVSRERREQYGDYGPTGADTRS